MVKTFTLRKELILIQLKHISKVYEGANRVEALKDISLDVKEGESLVLSVNLGLVNLH